MRLFLKIIRGSRVLLGVASGLIFIRLIGWQHPPRRDELYTAAFAVIILFALAEITGRALAARLKDFWKEKPIRAALAVVALLSGILPLALSEVLDPALARLWIKVVLLLVSIVGTATIVNITSDRTLSHLHPGIIGMVSFAAAIAVGALLLKSPRASAGESPIMWEDAFFTSASAVCVTGLITLDTENDFSFFGKMVIMGLIQAGGLGIMTWAYLVAVAWGEKTSLRDRMVLRDLMAQSNISNFKSRVLTIVLVTLIVEAIGFVLLYLSWDNLQDTPKSRWFTALFHAVSGYCNAGFSTFSGNLTDPLARQAEGAIATIAGLVILGGLGAPVWLELIQKGKTWTSNAMRSGNRDPDRYFVSLHTRVALTATGFLLMAGTICLYFADRAAFEGHTVSWAVSLFDSITARTAGFTIEDVSDYSYGTLAVLIALMFIGGNPGSTAGGIKCTTFAVVLVNLKQTIRDEKAPVIWGREIPARTVSDALSIITLGCVWIFLATVAIQWIHPDFHFVDILFEAVSAFGTVGLSRGITPELSTLAKWIVIVTMFVGRLGILLIFCSFLPPRPYSRLAFPKEAPLIS